MEQWLPFYIPNKRSDLRMCKLVICEKPSVALTISKVLGASRRSNGYLEGNGYVVSWCIGHLVELAQPECYEKRYAKWRREDLPIIPRFWKYQISAGTKKQFSILKQLMLRVKIAVLAHTARSTRAILPKQESHLAGWLN